MRPFIIILLLSLSIASHGQVNRNEEWRYVLLSTPLVTDSMLEKMLKTQSELSGQNERTKPEVTLVIDKVRTKRILGRIINSRHDTLKIYQNGNIPVEYFTEVRIAGVWKKFQTLTPQMCGMTLGTANLLPNRYCTFEIERKTTGNIKLPFRITVETKTGFIYSNIITMTCSKKQLDMVNEPIKPYTL